MDYFASKLSCLTSGPDLNRRCEIEPERAKVSMKDNEHMCVIGEYIE